MSKTVEHHETPDIEIVADQWEEEQEVLRQLEEQEEAFAAACDAIADMSDCPLTQVDSCTALMMIDGVIPIPECWEMETIGCADCTKNQPVAI